MKIGTHTFTCKGVVNNQKRKEIVNMVIQLQYDLASLEEEYNRSIEEGMEAFAPLFEENMKRIHVQLSTLLSALTQCG
jgi:homoserine trans-succinylase